MKQNQWQPCSAVRFGQVQSSQSMPPATTTCHNCNVLHAMLPLWCRLSGFGQVFLPAAAASPACQPAHVHPQVSLALPMTLTWATCNVCSLQRSRRRRRRSSHERDGKSFVLIWLLYAFCHGLSLFLSLSLPLLVCLSDNKDDKISRKNHKLCVYVWKNNIAQI